MCLIMSPPMISMMPMTMNQMPRSKASTVSEVTGVATTTIPAITLTTPKKIHQPRPSRSPPETETISEVTPCTIHVMPTNRPTSAMVRCR